MKQPPKMGLRRLAPALRYSLRGLRSAFRNEEAFRMEVLALLLLAPVGLILGSTGAERALLVGMLVLVLIVELLNSAIEAAVDRISPDFHALSQQAKDISSAAVFCTMLLALLTWGLILFWP